MEIVEGTFNDAYSASKKDTSNIVDDVKHYAISKEILEQVLEALYDLPFRTANQVIGGLLQDAKPVKLTKPVELQDIVLPPLPNKDKKL